MNASLTYSEEELYQNRNRIRIAVSLFYFCQGLAFASWASRIPIIKERLNLTEGQLGTILLMLPVGQLVTMALSGKLVTTYGSARVLRIVAIIYALILCLIGFAQNAWELGAILFFFGVIGNMCNIAVNTQGVAAEKIFKKSIMSSFHGAWSIAGFTGALIGLLTMNIAVDTIPHFIIIFVLIVINTTINYRYLIPGVATEAKKTSFFSKPESSLVQLGIIGFFSMATEGAMFDWSGVYFKEIVHAPEQFIIVGYASFMVMMALGRFIGDAVISRLGRKRTLQISGILMFVGMMTSVIFPLFYISTLAFMMVGIGVACNVPTVYSVAGQNKKVTPGVALAMVSSISFLGFLMGPPLIGYIAELTSLRYSYGVFAFFGVLMFIMVSKLKVFKEG
ncbi:MULTISPECIES: MFS transporter [Sphingobacterium]|uniref:MFS transporter n=1 Tax=Sphingobacterium kitahiroshimense TaxID=470446 RepID=A0ABV0BUR5_9SPHI|nr:MULTISPECIES: MFS transporter [Sphingobacterium]MBB2954501.1 MFS family permease [Sphingobacterium sp. JUb56]MCW2261851.1 MFS family permease [Sphingobacterium kitahiroshimense]NJI75578.1 MFS transporter [Sphingobacterium sp. B16(2022)]TCR10161.1 fucose permease [Sphingobacterium sp. JUb78]